jgi:hypothetical protein
VAVLNTTKGLRLIAVGVNVFEDAVSNKQLAAKSPLGIKKGTACFEQIRQKCRRSLSHQISAFGFFMSYSGTLASPPVIIDNGCNNPGDPPTIQ